MIEMRQAARLIKQGLVFAGMVAGSIAANCTIAVSPSQALSFAGSGGFLSLTNFEPGFSGVNTDTDTFTFSFAGQDASAIALADALANITTLPLSQAEQQSWALAIGQGTSFIGVGSGFSATEGFFDSTNSLQFDFAAVLGLISGSDRATPGEFGEASGTVGFSLFDDSNNLLDSFSLTGLVSSEGANSLSINGSSPFLSFDTPIFLQGGDGSTQFGLAVVRGSYSRTFDSPSALVIRGETRNDAIVAVPSPSLIPGVLTVMGVIGSKRKRKAAASAVEASDCQEVG